MILVTLYRGYFVTIIQRVLSYIIRGHFVTLCRGYLDYTEGTSLHYAGVLSYTVHKATIFGRSYSA
jgi:hypothetical protein